MSRIKVSRDRYLGEKEPCFIIAEMSANHGHDLKLAKTIIKAAAKAGADAIKIQTYTPETMTLQSSKKVFQVKNPAWKGQSLYDLYRKAYTPWEWHKELQQTAIDEGLVFFSSPFDQSAVDLLEKLKVPIYKIASFELVDLPLIKYVAKTGKPIIMSTGMASRQEIAEAVKTAKDNGAGEIILLKCVTSYPAIPEQMNLSMIQALKKRYKTLVGLSDHTLGTTVAIAAAAMGAKVIEKHFTLSRKLPSPDSFFSLEPQEFNELVEGVRLVEKAIGKESYALSQNEKVEKEFRRSIFVSKDIIKGNRFDQSNLQIVRPAAGLMPREYERVIGRIAAFNIKSGTPLKWRMIK